eukprot:7196017-Pyramimonas_sp.AAC.2
MARVRLRVIACGATLCCTLYYVRTMYFTLYYASEAAVKFIKVRSNCKPVQTLMLSFQMKGQPPRL